MCSEYGGDISFINLRHKNENSGEWTFLSLQPDWERKGKVFVADLTQS